jgi:hypothetical protein
MIVMISVCLSFRSFFINMQWDGLGMCVGLDSRRRQQRGGLGQRQSLRVTMEWFSSGAVVMWWTWAAVRPSSGNDELDSMWQRSGGLRLAGFKMHSSGINRDAVRR